MTTTRRRLVLAAAALAALLGGVGAFVAWKLPSDAQLVARITKEFDERTGVALKIGRLHWSLFPSPRIVVEEVATVQDEPIRAHRLAATMPWRAVLAKEVRIENLEADGVAVPRESTVAFRGKGGAGVPESTGGWTLAETPLARLRITDATWVDRRGIALTYDASVDFDPHWRPRTAELARRDASPPAHLRADREGEEDRWRIQADLADGTANGTAALKVAEGGRCPSTADWRRAGSMSNGW
ncbi:MAG: hypothetical protein ACRYGA_14700 [Janthinobacterium lividum]